MLRSHKKFLFVAAFSIAMALIVGSASAAPPPVGFNDAMDGNMVSLSNQMRSDYRAWGLSRADDAPVRYGSPYQVWGFDPSKVKGLTTDSADSAVQSALVGRSWEYPLINQSKDVVNAAQVSKGPNGWEVGAGLYLLPSTIALSSDDSLLKQAFESQGVSIQGETKHVRVASLHLDFVLGRSRDSLYALLLDNPTGVANLTSGKVYPSAFLVNKLSTVMTSGSNTGDGNQLQITGAPSQAGVSSTWSSNRLMIASLFLVAITLLFGVGLALKRSRTVGV